jgi:hypothetical protein
VHYDNMVASHPLVLGALVDSVSRELAQLELRSPSELGLLLVASGTGDPDTRSESYRLMRLVWEQVGAARGDVAFVRHPLLPLPEQLASCARSGLTWLCVPQFLWPTVELEYARVIFRDSVGQFELPRWRMADPLTEHPNVAAWLEQRMLELYRSHRNRLEGRLRSQKSAPAERGRAYGKGVSVPLEAWDPANETTRFGDALVARIGDGTELAALVGSFELEGERCLVKPTWHGYATGTYTDPLALDALLAALPGAVALVEGHTASRNSGDPGFDWEREAREHRVWIRSEEQRYLSGTGLDQVLRARRASYVNVTEAWWDEQCAPAAAVREVLAERGIELYFEELLGYVPRVLFELRGAPMLSYARFKGPTRLSLSNLFGLLPQPLRAAWHGPNITYFARVCCDLAKLYGALFRLHGVVESLSFAVRWERRGLYRSRWGNYDLVESPRVVCMSRGLAAADVLASRLQGQDVRKSAFFDVVRSELGYDPELATLALPDELLRLFV